MGSTTNIPTLDINNQMTGKRKEMRSDTVSIKKKTIAIAETATVIFSKEE